MLSPCEVLFLFSLLSELSGLGHAGPVGQRLQQTADVFIFSPGCTDGQLLLALYDTPTTHTHHTIISKPLQD